MGRGPLAGPVVAAAVVLLRPPAALLPLLDDSKRLSPARRAHAAAALEAARAAGLLELGLGAASVAEIACLNILQATLLAMRRAVAHLPAPPDFALVDGCVPPPLPCPLRCVPGGDRLSLSVAAASIVAKVARDRLMARLSRRYPAFGWQQNAGYGTAQHCLALSRCGPTPHHRANFAPVRRLSGG